MFENHTFHSGTVSQPSRSRFPWVTNVGSKKLPAELDFHAKLDSRLYFPEMIFSISQNFNIYIFEEAKWETQKNTQKISSFYYESSSSPIRLVFDSRSFTKLEHNLNILIFLFFSLDLMMFDTNDLGGGKVKMFMRESDANDDESKWRRMTWIFLLHETLRETHSCLKENAICLCHGERVVFWAFKHMKMCKKKKTTVIQSSFILRC